MDTADHRAHAGRAGRGHPLWTSTRVFALVLVVLGFGLMASRPPLPPQTHARTPEVAAARHAIEELVTPGGGAAVAAALPADFTASTGVEVALRRAPDGTVRAVHAGGGCSTPWGDHPTRWHFGVACKAHDLGYDLLRYAQARGQPLEPALRGALDARLSADMHDRCAASPAGSSHACTLVAWLYQGGTVLNSWHQRWGPPVGKPQAPMLAGVAAIGLLLMFRLSGWLRARRGWRATRDPADPPPAVPVAESAEPAEPAEPDGPDDTVDSGTRLPGYPGRAATLAVAAVVVIVLGESGLALARWAGADPGWLRPATWLVQLTCVFFFAGGMANAARWRDVRASGGGYRQYLACRASRLLRPAMVFAVVAFAVPMALELFGVGQEITTTAVRIALHPLWLLGVYVLTAVAAPAMLTVRARAPLSALAALAGGVLLAGLAARQFEAQVFAYVATLLLALLAQQVAFQSEHVRMGRGYALALTGAAVGALVLLGWLGMIPLAALGAPGAAPVLSAPAIPVALLGLAQFGVAGLAGGRLRRVAQCRIAARGTALALRAPMSLYLGFLTGMLLVITAVAVPSAVGGWLGWLAQPSSLLALCLPAVPAVLVFVCFERHLTSHPAPESYQQPGTGRLANLLARAATVLGVCYATIGLFGLALAGFGEVVGHPTVLGLSLEPIQSLVRMLLGICMLHTVRTGASHAPSTWVLATLACVPPILAAASGPSPEPAALALQGLTAVFALAASVTSACVRIGVPRAAPAAT